MQFVTFYVFIRFKHVRDAQNVISLGVEYSTCRKLFAISCTQFCFLVKIYINDPQI